MSQGVVRYVARHGHLQRFTPTARVAQQWDEEPPVEARYPGMIVYTDATSWDPLGMGRGWYGYHTDGTWEKLNYVPSTQNNRATTTGDNRVTTSGDNRVAVS